MVLESLDQGWNKRVCDILVGKGVAMVLAVPLDHPDSHLPHPWIAVGQHQLQLRHCRHNELLQKLQLVRALSD